MAKYHINPKTGNVSACKAEKAKCPYGSLEDHYDSQAAALQAFEAMQQGSFKKTPNYVQAILSKLPVIDYDGEEEWAEDNWGDGADYIMGELTDETRWVFANGQCLGLAEELASILGTNRIAIHHNTETSEDLVWDDEAGEPVLDEDGEEFFEEYESIHHAYAVAPDGTYWDINGQQKTDEIALVYRGAITEYESDQAVAAYAGFMTEQNKELARSMLRPIFEEHAAS